MWEGWVGGPGDPRGFEFPSFPTSTLWTSVGFFLGPGVSRHHDPHTLQSWSLLVLSPWRVAACMSAVSFLHI